MIDSNLPYSATHSQSTLLFFYLSQLFCFNNEAKKEIFNSMFSEFDTQSAVFPTNIDSYATHSLKI